MWLRCSRGACETNVPAVWWNSSTRAFYCEACAHQINKYSPGLCVERVRDARQATIYKWVADTFGVNTLNPSERALRFIEEAVELVQAVGLSADVVHKIVDHVFAKPPGGLAQEIGGCGTTLLALAAAHGVSADDAECDEAERVFKIDPARFRERHDAKARAGIAVFSQAPKREGDA